MGVNEGNCISCYLSNIRKGEPCCFLVTTCLPFGNMHALYRIAFDTTSLENVMSFNEANSSSSLDQGKHLASTLNRISIYNIYFMLCLCT
jgi:hypothetical protein